MYYEPIVIIDVPDLPRVVVYRLSRRSSFFNLSAYCIYLGYILSSLACRLRNASLVTNLPARK